MFQQTMRRQSVPGVLFIEDFEDIGGDHQVSISPVVDGAIEMDAAETAGAASAAWSEEEIERLRLTAYADGLADGTRNAEAGLSSQRIAILQRIDDIIVQASSEMNAVSRRDTEAIARTALSLLVECFPAFCERIGADETLRLLRSLLPSLSDEPKLTVTVCESLAGIVSEELTKLGDRAAQIVVQTDDLLPGDLRLTWQSGMACRDVRLLRAQMLARLSDFGLLEPVGDTVA